MRGGTYELYRYANADGTAKEWAWRDLGGGMALIRWGPENRLSQAQQKPASVARQRAKEKLAKGYRYIGAVQLTDEGWRSPTLGWQGTSAAPVPKPRQPIPVKPTKAEPARREPVDFADLLGDGDGEYF